LYCSLSLCLHANVGALPHTPPASLPPKSRGREKYITTNHCNKHYMTHVMLAGFGRVAQGFKRVWGVPQQAIWVPNIELANL